MKVGRTQDIDALGRVMNLVSPAPERRAAVLKSVQPIVDEIRADQGQRTARQRSQLGEVQQRSPAEPLRNQHRHHGVERHRADEALRIVRSHLDPVTLGDGRDLLQLKNSAGMHYVRLNIVDQVPMAQLVEAVLGNQPLAGCERNASLRAEHCQFFEIFELRRLLHEDRTVFLGAPAEVDRHRRRAFAVQVDADPELVADGLAHGLQTRDAVADGADGVDGGALRGDEFRLAIAQVLLSVDLGRPGEACASEPQIPRSRGRQST